MTRTQDKQFEKQSTRSELRKTGDPKKNSSMSRFTYYTNIKFSMYDREIKIPMKIDTGSAYTIVDMNSIYFDDYREDIRCSGELKNAYNVSGKPLNLYGCPVSNFKLTDDIVIPKIKIYFSEDTEEKSLLGMDILSLFTFQYTLNNDSLNGSFWIFNYASSLRRIEEHKLNRSLEYIDPYLIASIDEVDN